VSFVSLIVLLECSFRQDAERDGGVQLQLA
jgi:hypothetical protein